MEFHTEELTPLASHSATYGTTGPRLRRLRPNLSIKLISPASLRSRSMRQPKTARKAASLFHTPIEGLCRLASVVIAVQRSPKNVKLGTLKTIHPTTPIHFDFPTSYVSTENDDDDDNISMASAPTMGSFTQNPFATPPRGAAGLALASMGDTDGDIMMDLSPTGSMRHRRSQKKALQMLGNEAVGEVSKMRKLGGA